MWFVSAERLLILAVALLFQNAAVIYGLRNRNSENFSVPLLLILLLVATTAWGLVIFL